MKINNLLFTGIMLVIPFLGTGQQQDLDKSELDAMEEIRKNSGRYSLENFDHNSAYLDFAPAFYRQGLIFSSDRDTGNLARYRHSYNSRDFMDLYKITADRKKGIVAKKLEGVSSRWHESTSALSPDGTTLYFTRNNHRKNKIVTDEEGFVRLKIFRAFFRDSTWTDVEELSFNSNSYSIAHPALSPDGKTLYFASDMPGTRGKSDIFKVAIMDDGSFGTPENLGPTVNTEARETFPFVSSDGILYFSSDGLPGLGGLDIFAVELDNLQHEGKVLNVGTPVNSADDDITFIIDGNTRKGYFASNREGGLGGDDIYGFTELEPLVFECLMEVSGTVRDQDTNEVLAGATLRVLDENNQEVSYFTTDMEGNYQMTLNCDKVTFLGASREGYVASAVSEVTSDTQRVTLDFYLSAEPVVPVVTEAVRKALLDYAKTILFDTGKATIKPESESVLNNIADILDDYPNVAFRIEGHTDSVGSDSFNEKLSQARAQSVMNYLIGKGIPSDRMTAVGYGETRPIADNNTSEGRRTNRRVEIHGETPDN
jgi:outer membrane protein OmpA-like peptidoglycan-associated protein